MDDKELRTAQAAALVEVLMGLDSHKFAAIENIINVAKMLTKAEAAVKDKEAA